MITLKLVCLHIRLSNNLHNLEKVKLNKNLRFIFEEFLGIPEYSLIYNESSWDKIETLTQTQIDLLMSQNSHTYYRKRCDQKKKQAQEEQEEIDKELDVMIYDRNKDNFNQ